jgi:hypothetical protein
MRTFKSRPAPGAIGLFGHFGIERLNDPSPNAFGGISGMDFKCGDALGDYASRRCDRANTQFNSLGYDTFCPDPSAV